MPDLIHRAVLFWIALVIHNVHRVRGNDYLRVFIRRSNNWTLFLHIVSLEPLNPGPLGPFGIKPVQMAMSP